LGMRGVELSCYLVHNPRVDAATEGDGSADDVIVVLARDGEAVIRRGPRGLQYEASRGDPLKLNPILAHVRDTARLDDSGMPADRALFEDTVEHVYPDPLHRLWRAFHGLLAYPPDVLVSLSDGWFAGSADLAKVLQMAAVHGNLNQRGSTGFVMTTSA